MSSIDNFLTELRVKTPGLRILTSGEERDHYAQDWSKILTPKASAIVFPESTTQVSEILKVASAAGIAVVPSGGRTGLSAGAVATNGEVVLSLERLDFIGPLHGGALSLRVGAGAITEAVHEYCKPHGLTWPVDFASKGSSQVGGNLATNAGGVRVIRYGNTRNWVLGITAVTMDGTIHHFNGELEKNNTGYDFRQLLVGSEGTLAVITEATLKLCPLPRSKLAFFFEVENMPRVLELFAFGRAQIPNLSAFEYLDRACFQQVLAHFKLPSPFAAENSSENAKNIATGAVSGPQAYVLLEVENASLDDASGWLEKIFEAGLVVNGVMADNDRDFRRFWQYREGVAESILHGHDVHQEDVSVPIASLGEFYSTAHARYAQAFPQFKVFFFGHIGDGNLHIFIQKPEKMSRGDFLRDSKASDLELFKVLAQFKGSVSAEHGIGLLKKHALGFTRSAVEIELMRGLKKVFDPKGLLNPGKVI